MPLQESERQVPLPAGRTKSEAPFLFHVTCRGYSVPRTSSKMESVFVFFPSIGLFPPLFCKSLLGAVPNKFSGHNASLSYDSGGPNIRQGSCQSCPFPRRPGSWRGRKLIFTEHSLGTMHVLTPWLSPKRWSMCHLDTWKKTPKLKRRNDICMSDPVCSHPSWSDWRSSCPVLPLFSRVIINISWSLTTCYCAPSIKIVCVFIWEDIQLMKMHKFIDFIKIEMKSRLKLKNYDFHLLCHMTNKQKVVVPKVQI